MAVKPLNPTQGHLTVCLFADDAAILSTSLAAEQAALSVPPGSLVDQMEDSSKHQKIKRNSFQKKKKPDHAPNPETLR
ncbi:hypothetical protein TNCT_730711 [Trichonephila clavata]|uniref:Uncharacterized protein n=1 Tax=Trichonephila clavata TaxID=2740835 RepID=A0A8X6F255_TRICU|nr:hypothetical protein TNCT_730711 [Trichonephila clavata]